MEKSDRHYRVLALVNMVDRVLLESIFEKEALGLVFCNSLQSLLESLQSEHFPAVVFEEGFRNTRWQDVLSAISEVKPKPPHLLVVNHAADDRFWVKVMNLGVFNVLVKPFEIQEVTRILYYACQTWSEQAS